MNITLIFLTLILLSGMAIVFDRLVLAKKRLASTAQPGWLIELARSMFPVLIIVLIIRSFLVQPYRVPTGSLEPTVLPGDFIFVSQFAYGARIPLLQHKIISYGEPKRGDIALFYSPEKSSEILVKRVVGLPGDHIAYHHKTLVINGKKAPQIASAHTEATSIEHPDMLVTQKTENLLGKQHDILVVPGAQGVQDFDIDVPAGHYFMMGDNRDNSYDSRYFGAIPERDLIGQALVIWMSWDAKHYRIRWHRLGHLIK